MARLTRRVVSAGLLAAPVAAQAQPAPWTVPTNDQIRAILQQRIEVEHRGVGIVVGVVDAKGRRIVSHGTVGIEDPRPVQHDTLFEIGSITKVFTSLLLAEAVRRGEVALDDPVAKYVPAGVKVPERGGRQITLVDLATHTSALPRMPSNFAPKNPLNPYADYTPEQLFAFLSGYTLTRDIGAQYEYSNLAVGLLGQVLARRAGVDYETLVERRVLGPLAMKDTTITLSASQRARLAIGHTGRTAASNWDLPALAGAGALRSDADDMLTFLAAAMGLKASPLSPAFAEMLKVRRPAGAVGQVALGWHIRTGAREVIWHNGGTGGYRSYAGYDPAAKVGVVVLTNTTEAPGSDDIGLHLLIGAPLAKMAPIKLRQAIVLPPGQLTPLVGAYTLGPQGKIIIAENGGRLFAQITGQALYELFAEGPNDFFWKVTDAQLTFTRKADGSVTGAVIHQSGRDIVATRVP